eukprot:3434004-Amphidinium_carterae.1
MFVFTSGLALLCVHGCVHARFRACLLACVRPCVCPPFKLVKRTTNEVTVELRPSDPGHIDP